MGTVVEETKKVDMEMPEKEEKEEKEEMQTYSVSSKPQQQIRNTQLDIIVLSEEDMFEFEEDLRPKPSEAELLEFEEDLREFIALRAACKKVQPNVVQTVRRPRTVGEDIHYHTLRAAKCSIEMYELNYCKNSESLSETDSTDSGVCMKSASSMSEPINFNPQRKQSCAVCEEAVKDPVLLPCGHWSCKQCSHSFWDECGDSDPCKKCGRRSEREKRDQDLRSVLLEKKIKRVEMETEKLQAEKETFELEKRKLALEIQLLEQKGKYTN